MSTETTTTTNGDYVKVLRESLVQDLTKQVEEAYWYLKRVEAQAWIACNAINELRDDEFNQLRVDKDSIDKLALTVESAIKTLNQEVNAISEYAGLLSSERTYLRLIKNV